MGQGAINYWEDSHKLEDSLGYIVNCRSALLQDVEASLVCILSLSKAKQSNTDKKRVKCS